jgi:sterol desaturase/sphingolipid hydroxylase (fatty acid hydroxylase superfamily)
MNEIVQYFQHIPSVHRSFLIVGGIMLFSIIETGFPLFKTKYKKWQHAGINIFFTLTTIIINFVLAFILFKSSIWVTENHFGILNWLSIKSLLLQAIVGLLLMDLIGAYTAHLVEHKVKILWRFHLIHHTDVWVDATSANRHHPGESIIRFFFTTCAILIVGAPIWLFFMYQSASVLLSQFNHANISIPRKLDTFISYFIVSPNMHKVHHHYILPYTDSNYGNIFSVWDRLFGTFLILEPEQITYGIDTHMNPEYHNKIISLLTIPFKSRESFISNSKK